MAIAAIEAALISRTCVCVYVCVSGRVASAPRQRTVDN